MMGLQQLAVQYITMAINALEMVEEEKPIGERNYMQVNRLKTVWVDISKEIESAEIKKNPGE